MIHTFINSTKSVHCVLEIDCAFHAGGASRLKMVQIFKFCRSSPYCPQNSLGKNNVLRNEKGKNCLALIPGIILKRFARTFSPSQKLLFLKSEFIYIILHA